MLLAGEDSRQRARRVMAVHRPDPMEAAIAAEIEAALEDYKKTVEANLEEDLKETKRDYARLQELAGDAVGTLKANTSWLQHLKALHKDLEPIRKALAGAAGAAVEISNVSTFVAWTDPKTQVLYKVEPHEMKEWLEDLRLLLEAYGSMVREAPAPAVGGDRVCETCGRFGVGPCEGCNQETAIHWTPKQIGKGG